MFECPSRLRRKQKNDVHIYREIYLCVFLYRSDCVYPLCVGKRPTETTQGPLLLLDLIDVQMKLYNALVSFLFFYSLSLPLSSVRIKKLGGCEQTGCTIRFAAFPSSSPSPFSLIYDSEKHFHRIKKKKASCYAAHVTDARRRYQTRPPFTKFLLKTSN